MKEEVVAEAVEDVKEEIRYLLFGPFYNVLFIIPIRPRLDSGLLLYNYLWLCDRIFEVFAFLQCVKELIMIRLD